MAAAMLPASGSSGQWVITAKTAEIMLRLRERDSCIRMYNTILYFMYTAADGSAANSRMNRDNMRQASETRRTNLAEAVTVLFNLLIITHSQWSASPRR